jgi:Ca-activated chloride channel family protein
MLKAGDKIGSKRNGYAATLLVNNPIPHMEDKEPNKYRAYKISNAAIPDRNMQYSAADDLSPETVKQGSLLFIVSDGDYSEAPRLHTDVNMVVNGMIARVTVKQRFENSTTVWQEGIYVFPLPENAAVDHLTMQVGERMIEGEIKPRDEANTIYTQAKHAGKKASLVEQARPNIFSTSVANIGPNDSITVQIEYQHSLRYTEAGFSLRFPMVVGPRYTPRAIIEETLTQPNAEGWRMSTAEPLHISPAMPDSTNTPPFNPVNLQVDLNPGMPLAKLHSLYHPITKTSREDGHILIELSGENHADRDFVLEWQPDTGHQPQAALFTEEKNDQHYIMLMIMPSVQSLVDKQRLPREGIFVIDTSGSMNGNSILQAKLALRYALKQLRPGDRFNVIQFNGHASCLFSTAQPVDDKNIDHALHYVEGLNAEGGTEMAEALRLALNGGTDLDAVRQVVFLTDGSISNERQLFDIIRQRLGDSRLFTVGIGSAPNSFFMHKAAQFGRGTFTYIGDTSEVATKMNELFSKLETPVMTNLNINWPAGVTAEMWPRRLPDIYHGEPLILKARLNRAEGELIVTGRVADKLWRSRINLESAVNDKGMGVLWARTKIVALMDSVHEGVSRDAVKKSVVEVALAHHLVSRYTSLVAVDKLVSRAPDQKLESHKLPVNLPYGMEHKEDNKRPYKISKPSPPSKSHPRFSILTNWWNNDLWDSPSKRQNTIAAARSLRKKPLAIPLLACRQRIVGTGKRLLYLGWSGNNQSSSYTVTVKRKGTQCKIDNNCWKTTTNQSFTSLRVNLKKGIYEVNVEAGTQFTTGYFKVITSPSHFFEMPSTKEEQTEWALKLLTQSKCKWTLEAYQQVAAASISDNFVPARQLKVRLEEGLSISIPKTW